MLWYIIGNSHIAFLNVMIKVLSAGNHSHCTYFRLTFFARDSILKNRFSNYGSDTALMLIRQGGIALLQTG